MSTPTPLPLPDTILEEIGQMLRQDPYSDAFAWLDLVEKNVVLATSTYGLDEGETPEEEEEQVPGGAVSWQAEDRERVRRLLADPGRYVRIPVGADHGAPGRLSGFAATLPDGPLRDDVYDAMRGKGAFRRVKSVLYDAGALDLWHAYEDLEDRNAARYWLREEGFDAGGIEGEIDGELEGE